MADTTAVSTGAANSSSAHPFGIDFGGSGIKGAPVDLATGEFAADRTRVETPKGGKPKDVADVVAELVDAGPRRGQVRRQHRLEVDRHRRGHDVP
jgi:hypothetical protein